MRPSIPWLALATGLLMAGCHQPAPEPAPAPAPAEQAAADAPPPAGAPDGQPPNVVLIVIDGLRHDRTGFGGNPRKPSPNLDHFAAQSLVFDNAHSQSNESLFSHASMFTGAYPSEIAHPDYLQYLIPDSSTVVAEVLQAVGYDTAAFVAGGHVKALFGFEQGFEHFEEGRDFGSFFDPVPKALSWMEGRAGDPDPSFIFLHGYDMHRPYGKSSVFFKPFGRVAESWVDERSMRRSFTERIYAGVFHQAFRHPRILHETGERVLDPTSYRSMAEWVAQAAPDELIQSLALTTEDLEVMREHYDASLLAADAYVGLFLEHLEAQGLMDDTLVIITSDHGEGLQEHPVSNHRMGLYDTTTHVPFIIGGGALPPQWRGKRSTDLTSAVDLASTLTDVAGTVPIAGARGRSLWAMLQGKPSTVPKGVYQEGVIGHVALRTAEWRLVFDGLDLTAAELDSDLSQLPVDGGRFSLFHTSADPLEQENVVVKYRDHAEEMRQELVRIRKANKRGGARMETPQAVKDMLQSKGGYF